MSGGEKKGYIQKQRYEREWAVIPESQMSIQADTKLAHRYC